MGGSTLAAADIASLAQYLQTLRPHPNPNRLLDDTLPESILGGDPIHGEAIFNSPVHRCAECHADESAGTNNVDSPSVFGFPQPVKNPLLRTVYQRRFFNPQPGANSLSGFGLNHDGAGGVHARPGLSAEDSRDVDAFIQCIESGVPPAVGLGVTFNALSATDSELLEKVAVLEEHATAFELDLVVQGVIAGRRRAFFFDSFTSLFRPDVSSEAPLSRTALLSLLGGADAITFLGVPYGRGSRIGGDHDSNAVLDGDEPMPLLTASLLSPNMHLRWPVQPPGWVLEFTPDLNEQWQTVTHPRSAVGNWLQLDDPLGGVETRYYRMRRAW
jgi:hypothetical protein